MNLIIPVSHNDADLLAKLAKVFVHLGQCKGHKLYVVPSENAEQEAHAFKDKVASLFDHAAVRPVRLGITGWPIAPNRHFRAVCKLAIEEYNDAPFWFFEPDCTPVRKGWLQRCEHTYLNGRKPFCGAIVPTRVINAQTGKPGYDGKHMVGCGIYPPDMYNRSTFMQTIDLRQGWSPLPLEPFDVRIRMEVVPYAYNLPELQHNWRTVNYRMEDGRVVCDSHPDNAEYHDYANPVEETTYVVHGCRDSSLADLVLKGAFEGKTVDASTPAPEPKEETPTSGFTDFRIKSYVRDNQGKTVKTIASDLELEEEVVRNHIKSGEYAKIGPGGRVNLTENV